MVSFIAWLQLARKWFEEWRRHCCCGEESEIGMHFPTKRNKNNRAMWPISINMYNFPSLLFPFSSGERVVSKKYYYCINNFVLCISIYALYFFGCKYWGFSVVPGKWPNYYYPFKCHFSNLNQLFTRENRSVAMCSEVC